MEVSLRVGNFQYNVICRSMFLFSWQKAQNYKNSLVVDLKSVNCQGAFL